MIFEKVCFFRNLFPVKICIESTMCKVSISRKNSRYKGMSLIPDARAPGGGGGVKRRNTV